jgi:hypothetical protein
MKQRKMVTIDGYTQESAFHFEVFHVSGGIPGVYGTRVFFKDPTVATIEILNKFSMWGGPDKCHWGDESVQGWEFDTERLLGLAQFVQAMTGNDITQIPVKINPVFRLPELLALPPTAACIYSVQANEDQLIKHGYNLTHYWDQVYWLSGKIWKNRLRTKFENIGDAIAFYEELSAKKLVAMKNWL